VPDAIAREGRDRLIARMAETIYHRGDMRGRPAMPMRRGS
jgi:hypothetical protein